MEVRQEAAVTAVEQKSCARWHQSMREECSLRPLKAERRREGGREGQKEEGEREDDPLVLICI